MHHLLRTNQRSVAASRMRAECLVPPCLSICRRNIVKRNGTKCVSIVKVQDTKLRVAKPRGICQHGLEYRLKRAAGRAADDLQDLGSRGLLLQRLGELLFQVGIGCSKAVNVSSPLRCFRTKTGNGSSALRPFASQDHLVGTVTGPPSGRPSQDGAYRRERAALVEFRGRVRGRLAS